MNERKLLLGWKRITEYTGISRLLMIRYAYPVHDCDRQLISGTAYALIPTSLTRTGRLSVHNIDITILGEQALAALMQRLSEARGKHPVFAEGKYHALGVIGEEYRELVYAVEHETPERIRDEALDVAVTALRLWLGEHKVGAHE